MARIKKTRISTSPTLDICQGFALFPNIGTIRAGRTFSAPPGKHIINTGRKTILLWQFSATVDYRIFAGICGPAYATLFDVSGEINSDTAMLKVELDQAAAGVFAGLTVFFPYDFVVRSGSVKWTLKKGFYTTWKNSFHKQDKTGYKIDLLEKLVEFILKKLKEDKKDGDGKIEKQKEPMKGVSQEKKKQTGKEDEKEEDEKEEDKDVKVSSFAIYSQVENQFAKLGEMLPQPTFSLPIDIVPYIEPLAAVDAALKAVWGGFQVGPRLDFIVPVHIKPSGASLDNTRLGAPKIQNGALTMTGAHGITSPEYITMEMTHQSEFKFGVALYTSISACKLFSFNQATPRLVLNDLLGIKIATDPHCNYLTSLIGNLNTSEDVGSCDSEKISVVFEP
jgi:hypothetical protein